MPVPDSRPIDALRRFVGVAFEGYTYRRLLYLALAFPLGIAYFVTLVVTFALGVSLAVLLVGIPILVVAIAFSIGFLALERVLASLLLDVEFDSSMKPGSDSVGEYLRRILVHRRTLLGLVYLPSKLFVGIGAFVLLWCTVGISASLLLTPLYYEGVTVGIHLPETVHLSADLGFSWGDRTVELAIPVSIGSWIADSLVDALGLSIVGCCLLLASLHLTNLAGRLLAVYARLLLR